jgi:hypothetical protein
MASNSAYMGGAVKASELSSVTATDCTMASNTAYSVGGAVSADSHSAVDAINCTMTSNSAAWAGGAVHLAGGADVVLAFCALVSNVASEHGGAIAAAVALDGGLTTGAVQLSVASCNLTHNHAGDQVALHPPESCSNKPLVRCRSLPPLTRACLPPRKPIPNPPPRRGARCIWDRARPRRV